MYTFFIFCVIWVYRTIDGVLLDIFIYNIRGGVPGGPRVDGPLLRRCAGIYYNYIL